MTLLATQRELLGRFRAGEKPALEEVYRHYAPAVAAFLAKGFIFRSGEKMLRFAGYSEPFDLDNTLQETFLRALRPSARAAYDGVRPYKQYLFTIARNLVVDQLRGREVAFGDATDVLAADEAGAQTLASAECVGLPGSEGALLREELGRLYAAFVGALSERDRAFFEARFEAEGTQVDAGRAVGLSHMQSRSLEKKLRTRFLAYMQVRGYLEASGP